MVQFRLINHQAGLSLIELLVAMAIFVIVASTGATVVIGAFSVGRLSQETTVASLRAQEGVTALRSIQEQNWGSIASGSYGLQLSSGNWSLQATPDVDTTGKYTRTIVIEPVNRDATAVISSTGQVDPETYKATVKVQWFFTPVRSNQIEVTTLVTNWRASAAYAGGMAQPAGCAQACTAQGKTGGACMPEVVQCALSGWQYVANGDVACSRGSANDRCCCTP